MAISSKYPGKVYKFVHYNDEFIRTNLTGRSFSEKWLNISDDGIIKVKGSNTGGYAWDGCSPKWNFIDLIWGTPDGRFDYRTDKQITYYASMVHDALYQYKSKVKLSRKEVDVIFKLNLRKAGFRLWWIYYAAVRLFGGLYGKWMVKETCKGIEISEFSWLISHV